MRMPHAVRAVTLTGLVVVASTAAPRSETAETRFFFGGYVKLDVIATDYDGGSVGTDNPLRDFHIPGLIPIGGRDSDTLDFHAKASRFNLGTETDFGEGPVLKSFVELDFLLSDNGDERVSSSYQPRLRHYYLEYGPWLLGQYWNTFMIVSFPDDLDFIGSPDGMIFGRQAMIRYTRGPWQFALENPDTTVTPFGGGDRIDSDTGIVPDAVARYNWSGDWGKLSVAGLVRRLDFEDAATGVEATELGYGVNFGGLVKVGRRDDVRFQVSAGDGLGRYAALNFANAAVLDGNDELQTIGTVTATAAYRHLWNDRWRSTFNANRVEVDNDVSLIGPDANESAWSASANLLYSPREALVLGVELMHAVRELESGMDGSFNRLQFSARYNFSYSSGKKNP